MAFGEDAGRTTGGVSVVERALGRGPGRLRRHKTEGCDLFGTGSGFSREEAREEETPVSCLSNIRVDDDRLVLISKMLARLPAGALKNVAAFKGARSSAFDAARSLPVRTISSSPR